MERHFEQQIDELKQQLLHMSGLAERIIRKAVESLHRRDPALADEIFRDDRVIDRLEIEIEERCIQLIALQQPLATDLRLITSALKISNDLERVGDHAVNIAGCAKALAELPSEKPLSDLGPLVEGAIGMLREALDAFVHRDADSARRLVLQRRYGRSATGVIAFVEPRSATVVNAGTFRGRVFVAALDRVIAFGPAGASPSRIWDALGDNVQIVGLAADTNQLWLCDAGQRVEAAIIATTPKNAPIPL